MKNDKDNTLFQHLVDNDYRGYIMNLYERIEGTPTEQQSKLRFIIRLKILLRSRGMILQTLEEPVKFIT